MVVNSSYPDRSIPTLVINDPEYPERIMKILYMSHLFRFMKMTVSTHSHDSVSIAIVK